MRRTKVAPRPPAFELGVGQQTNGVLPAPTETAKAAGLRYVSDSKPGISRRAAGRGFVYTGPDCKRVRDAETLRRIRSLAIPPAWTNVWICPAENGHLQATGRDARNRKQYRYHARWNETRDAVKYEKMIAFGQVLPRIRKRIATDLRRRNLPREKVLAAVVRFLETTLIRVGNDEYAAANKSYGLTTLRNRHARVKSESIEFEFVGKGGKRHRIGLKDARLAKIVRKCQDLPGQELFAYIDEEGNVRDITSDDVNAYLRDISGMDITAKDFRTWAGTVLAAIALREFEEFGSSREAKRNITKAVEAVSQMLGNTPAICRRCYVHPVVLASYLEGETIAVLKQRAERVLARKLNRLTPEEAAVLMLLHEKLEGPAPGRGRISGSGRRQVSVPPGGSSN